MTTFNPDVVRFQTELNKYTISPEKERDLLQNLTNMGVYVRIDKMSTELKFVKAGLLESIAQFIFGLFNSTYSQELYSRNACKDVLKGRIRLQSDIISPTTRQTSEKVAETAAPKIAPPTAATVNDMSLPNNPFRKVIDDQVATHKPSGENSLPCSDYSFSTFTKLVYLREFGKIYINVDNVARLLDKLTWNIKMEESLLTQSEKKEQLKKYSDISDVNLEGRKLIHSAYNDIQHLKKQLMQTLRKNTISTDANKIEVVKIVDELFKKVEQYGGAAWLIAISSDAKNDKVKDANTSIYKGLPEDIIKQLIELENERLQAVAEKLTEITMTVNDDPGHTEALLMLQKIAGHVGADFNKAIYEMVKSLEKKAIDFLNHPSLEKTVNPMKNSAVHRIDCLERTRDLDTRKEVIVSTKIELDRSLYGWQKGALGLLRAPKPVGIDKFKEINNDSKARSIRILESLFNEIIGYQKIYMEVILSEEITNIEQFKYTDYLANTEPK